MSRAFIGFGANLGDVKAKFREAVQQLNLIPQTCVKRTSSLYETEPVGIVDGGPPFINAVIELQTWLPPRSLFEIVRQMELKLGKSTSHSSNQSRIIDLDVLMYDDIKLSEPDFELPHPRMFSRAFVLVPLCEIAAQFVDPKSGLTVGRLLEQLSNDDKDQVRLASPNYAPTP